MELRDKKEIFKVGVFVSAYRYSVKVGWHYGQIISANDEDVTVRFLDDTKLQQEYPYHLIGTKEDKENLESFIKVVDKSEIIRYLYPRGKLVMLNIKGKGWYIARISGHLGDGVVIRTSEGSRMILEYTTFDDYGRNILIRDTFKGKRS